MIIEETDYYYNGEQCINYFLYDDDHNASGLIFLLLTDGRLFYNSGDYWCSGAIINWCESHRLRHVARTVSYRILLPEEEFLLLL